MCHDCTDGCICTKANEGEWNERVVPNPECALTGHAGEVNMVEFSPCGKRIVSGSDDGMVKIWDAATGAEVSSHQGCTL